MNITKERLEEMAFAGDERAEMARYILELQKLSPIYQVAYDGGWSDVDKWEYDQAIEDQRNHRIIYAYPVPPAASQPVPKDIARDALRYRFLRDKDAFGADNEPGLASWDDLVDLGYNEFDAAVDARIAHPDIDYVKFDRSGKIQPMKPECDEDGYWTHPKYLEFCDEREFIPREELDAWASKMGTEWGITYLENDDLCRRNKAVNYSYFVCGDCDISLWIPTPPDGDGWFIISIHDTEDGPVCCWMRDK